MIHGPSRLASGYCLRSCCDRIAAIFLTSFAFLILAQSSSAQPNVVLFFVDDMGWTDWQESAVQPLGSPVYETPNLLALAGSGVTFSNAYSSAPVCSPTRASLMTGKNSARTRITDWIGAGNSSGTRVRSPTDWTKNLAANEVTLAEAMKSGGYNTAFFGKWHLGQSGNPGTTPLAHGFDSNIGGAAAGNPGFAGGFFAGADGAWSGMPGLDTAGTYPSTKYLSDALAEKAADYITNSQQGADPDPFFMTMSHYLVHTPLQAPSDLVAKYTNKINALQTQGSDLKGHNNATYAAMVEKMDQSLGTLMQRLDDPNNDGNTSDSVRHETIIVFASDHGGLDTSANAPTDNAPLREGKGSLYEGGTRVPFIVSWNGNSKLNQGTMSASRTSSHDIYPTLLDLTGVPGDTTQNANMDGVSIRRALEGQAFDRGYQYWHYPHVSPQDAGSSEVNGGSFVSSVIKDDWKLVYFYDSPRYELYNLADDLSESQSVLLANPEIANSLSEALGNYLSGIDAQMPISIATGMPVDKPPTLAIDAAAPIFHDTFGQNHNFKTQGVVGTRWDGLMNASSSVGIASQSTTGTLDISSDALFVANNFSAPFLYKKVAGDFEAVMEIESMDSLNYHVAAIVAADPAAIAQDFLWVGQQNRNGDFNDFGQSRNIEDGVRLNEQTISGDFRFFRLVREGGLFVGSVSHDGALWQDYASYTRPDLPEEILVGITQGTFSSNTATLSIADFSIDLASPGDFNLDGVVDSADLEAWRLSYGTLDSPSQSEGDADLDRDIDGADFLEWQRGASSTPPSTTSAVPEPTGAQSLLMFFCFGICLRY